MRQREHQPGFGTIEVLLVVLVVAALAVTGLLVYQRYKPSSARNSATTSPSQTTTQPKSTTTTQPAQSVYTGWKTYTSTNEKAHFQYPSNWTTTKPFTASNDTSNTDQIGITSPSGAVTVSWVTDLT